MTAVKKSTPMLEQYWRLKKEQPDALLLFRLGDFYELFEEDAEVAAPILDVQLTSRDGRVPMCGVPHHAVNQYARRLLSRGFTVAIAEQMEDPAVAKGLVDRQIVRVLTPGTLIPEEGIEVPRLGVIFRHRSGWSVVVAELSTGTVHIVEGTHQPAHVRQLDALWSTWGPDEYLTNWDREWPGTGKEVDGQPYFRRTDARRLEAYLAERLGSASLRSWGLEERRGAQEALAALWRYLESIQRRSPHHLSYVQFHQLGQEMALGRRALRQLDIVGGDDSLFKHLNMSVTAMGSRLLKEWLESPSRMKAVIEKRSQAVAFMVNNPLVRDSIRASLHEIGDLSRRVSRMAMGLGRPRDVAGIRDALVVIPDIMAMTSKENLWPCPCTADTEWFTRLHQALDVLHTPPPVRWEDSPLIRPGQDTDIDCSRALLEDQRRALVELEEQERIRSRIKTLRVGYHRTFGYYLEVTKSQAKEVPQDWHRRQTTTHTERFVSDALRELETSIQGAEERIRQRERQWTTKLEDVIVESAAKLTEIAGWLAQMDVLSSLAQAAVHFQYHAPQWIDGERGGVVLENLRHPVLEQLLDEYVSHDLVLTPEQSTLIITGPNMGGKSTFMRALAQNVVMAQIGGFVAATQFRVPVCDAILPRIGADDDLIRGQSTFMVEMEEVASILRQANSESLVLLDELGRGTSTFDGMAIAYAVIERLAVPKGPLTLFATHYHELTELATSNPHALNLTVEVLEGTKGPIFTHRIIAGRTSRSYGLEVARLAGLPAMVLTRAERYLKEWEDSGRPTSLGSFEQLTLFAPDPLQMRLLEALRTLDPEELSPREAWQWLFEWHQRLKGGGFL